MRRISVIGIGSGDPEQVTVQAINVLNTVDVIFMVDKGEGKRELTDLRREICARYISGDDYRIVTAAVEILDEQGAEPADEHHRTAPAGRGDLVVAQRLYLRADLGPDVVGEQSPGRVAVARGDQLDRAALEQISQGHRREETAESESGVT